MIRFLFLSLLIACNPISGEEHNVEAILAVDAGIAPIAPIAPATDGPRGYTEIFIDCLPYPPIESSAAIMHYGELDIDRPTLLFGEWTTTIVVSPPVVAHPLLGPQTQYSSWHHITWDNRWWVWCGFDSVNQTHRLTRLWMR